MPEPHCFFGITPSLIACKDKDASAIETDQIDELLTTSKALGTAVGLTADPIDKVRVGMIGMGNRGSVLIPDV